VVLCASLNFIYVTEYYLAHLACNFFPLFYFADNEKDYCWSVLHTFVCGTCLLHNVSIVLFLSPAVMFYYLRASQFVKSSLNVFFPFFVPVYF